MLFKNPVYENAVIPLVGKTVHTFSLFRDSIIQLIEESVGEEEFLTGIKPILYFAADRSQALIMLIQYGYLWDAEILFRPVMESTCRILFISFAGTKEERIKRCNEFWVELSELNQLKQSERAQILIDLYPDDGGQQFVFGPLILSDDDKEEIRRRWPRNRQKALEQKWSFSEIIKTVEMNTYFGKEKNFFHSLKWNYGLSSHLIHADETGIGLVGDRLHRPDQEREKLSIAHAARLLADQISFIGLIHLAIEHVLTGDKKKAKALYSDCNSLFMELDVIAKTSSDTPE